MSARKILTAEWQCNDLLITGILDNGDIDPEDGLAIDPAWLRTAALAWMQTGGIVRAGVTGIAGTGEKIWADGTTTKLAARITAGHVARMIAGGAISELEIGILKPVIRTDDTAPAGVITGGRLTVAVAQPHIMAAA